MSNNNAKNPQLVARIAEAAGTSTGDIYQDRSRGLLDDAFPESIALYLAYCSAGKRRLLFEDVKCQYWRWMTGKPYLDPIITGENTLVRESLELIWRSDSWLWERVCVATSNPRDLLCLAITKEMVDKQHQQRKDRWDRNLAAAIAAKRVKSASDYTPPPSHPGYAKDLLA